MKNIEVLLSLIGTCAGLFLTALTFLLKFIKNKKAKKAAEYLLKITNALVPYIEQAEKFTSYSGQEKKEYVLTKANQFAIDNNIQFNKETVSEKIEELVLLTKQVNIKNKENTEKQTWL